MSEKLSIRPYARLITMLGDQLIKNESIALLELIKNSYDADASFVNVDFENFNEDMSCNGKSEIIIEDDGNGMDRDILESAWLNPATPIKLLSKNKNQFTDKGRIIQGEKGIGRFAVFKLGKKIEIVTRRQKRDREGHFIDEAENVEYVLTYDFSEYDSDFLKYNNEDKELFLDEISVDFEERSPIELVEKRMIIGVSEETRKPYGTIIRISDLKLKLNDRKISRIENDINRLQPIILDGTERTGQFRTYININGNTHFSSDSSLDKIKRLLIEAYTFRISGSFEPGIETYQVNISRRGKSDMVESGSISFDDPRICGIKKFREYFKDCGAKEANKGIVRRELECGKFSFDYYIFDLDKKNRDQLDYVLDDEEENLIKSHRIYLYRDNVRVMPYGDKEDDWLGLDSARGNESASSLVSNDQTVGFVFISQRENPKLKDKTNREGLIDEGHAFEDFKFVNEILLRFFRANIYRQYLIDKKKRAETNRLNKGTTLDVIDKERSRFKDNNAVHEAFNRIEQSYKNEKEVYYDRINKTQDLSAVGLATRMGTHDARIELGRINALLNDLIKEISRTRELFSKDKVLKQLRIIQDTFYSVNNRMNTIQKLFPSTRSWTRDIRIKSVVDVAYNLSKSSLDSEGIVCNIIEKGNELVVRMTEASLVQIFINLFDNSLYWLKTGISSRRIEVLIDGDYERVIFSDNGPGIENGNIPYIFEPFFSTKADDGSGLGLYISKSLMERYGYKMYLNDRDREMLLSGASFVLDFES